MKNSTWQMRAHPGAVTIKQIAQRAGCSVTAVSKALNNAKGSAIIGPAMRERVMRVASELGYRPNYHARSLVSKRGHTLGLLIRHGIGDLFWGQLVQGISQAAQELDHDLLIISPADGVGEVDQAIRYLGEHRIDSLIAPGAMYRGPDTLKLEKLNLPIVLAGGDMSSALPTVNIDLRPGVVAAVEHLVALGHKEILWVEADAPTGKPAPKLLVEQDRLAALVETARRMGVKLVLVRLSTSRQTHPDVSDFVAACREAFSAYLAHNRPCSAVVAYNEQIGLGVMAALANAGYDVPVDVSVIGFDNLYAHLMVPAMTVVSQRLPDRGVRAAQLAIEMSLKSKHTESWQGYREWLPATLVLRQSTAAIKA